MIVKLTNRYLSLIQGMLAVLLLVLFFAGVGFYLFQHHQSLLTTTLNNHTEQQQRVWSSVLQGYSNGMEAYFASIVMQEPVLELLRQAQDGDDRSTALTRVHLFRLLYDANSELRKRGVRQLHFHTTDSRSFLRFHFPHRFGDSLKDIRPTVVEANRTLKPVVGFEGGRGWSAAFATCFRLSLAADILAASSLVSPLKPCAAASTNYIQLPSLC